MAFDDYNEDEEREWFSMEAFIRSGQHIGPLETGEPKRKLANLDIEGIPSPTLQDCTEEGWQLGVRGWGLVIITEKGVRLLWRHQLGDAAIEALGRPWD